jgi:hypothetical protein
MIATGYEAATVRSFGDFLDCIGWAAMSDVPQFVYNPMLTSIVLVSIVKLGAGVVLAVKILIDAQLWLALLSMACLYRTQRRSLLWALLAGLLYALFPATALQISGNLDLGFSVALAPLALAAGIVLVRRFGPSGLPLAGALCGLVGLGFSTENLFVVSAPLFAAVILFAYSTRRLAAWMIAALGGLVATVGVGLYCIFPTIASTGILTSPATRIAEVEGGGMVALFGESIPALWHGVLVEATLSPLPEFNVSTLLWTTSIALTIVWWAALVFASAAVELEGDS